VVLPNGSRLSCGRLARRRKGAGRSPCPARAQHSASFKAITARQLQALVRHHGSGTSRSRQILRAKKSLISRCLGTVEVLRAGRLM